MLSCAPERDMGVRWGGTMDGGAVAPGQFVRSIWAGNGEVSGRAPTRSQSVSLSLCLSVSRFFRGLSVSLSWSRKTKTTFRC